MGKKQCYDMHTLKTKDDKPETRKSQAGFGITVRSYLNT